MTQTALPPDLPPLAELGRDLVTTSRFQQAVTLIRPFLCFGAYWLCAMNGWWIPALLAIAALFIAIVATAHDLAHQAISLPRRANDVLLALVGMLVFESGHAYQVTHLQHHRRFPHDDDPEGDPSRMTFARALLEGPLFLFRLWLWAWRRAPAARGWLALEAAWFALGVLAAIALWSTVPAVTVFVALAIAGSWTYPLATVYLPHNVHGTNALLQTYTLRGRVIPALFLELTYHLEHHLYPAVPSHHYAELARRIEPYLHAAGVEPVRVL